MKQQLIGVKNCLNYLGVKLFLLELFRGVLQKGYYKKHLCWRHFCGKIVSYVSARSIRELCYWRFLRNFPKILTNATFRNSSGQLLQLLQKLSCSPFLLSYIMILKFEHQCFYLLRKIVQNMWDDFFKYLLIWLTTNEQIMS